jgi:hypothetical protein
VSAPNAFGVHSRRIVGRLCQTPIPLGGVSQNRPTTDADLSRWRFTETPYKIGAFIFRPRRGLR